MATLATLPGIEDFMKQKVVVERQSYESVSDELRRTNPSMRGLSSRSIRRFCAERGIRATSRLNDAQLDKVVATSVAKVHWQRSSNCIVVSGVNVTARAAAWPIIIC